ncbi:MAG: hypothetical protein AAF390_17680, partial [Pseudomonadota bacterium]
DTPFRLSGSARALAWLWLPNWGALMVCAALWALAVASFGGAVPLPTGPALAIALLVPLVAVWIWVRWRVRSYRQLVSDIRWGEDVRMDVAPRVGRIVRIHLFGWIIVAVLLVAALFAAGIAFGVLAVSTAELENLEEALTGGGAISPYLLVGAGVFSYLGLFLLRGTFRLAFVTFPLIRHVAETLAITGAAEIGAARQGTRRHMADADGFANLFDLGAGI